jgi:hypothetical protein
MSEATIVFNPDLCIPAKPNDGSYGPFKGILWLIFLAGGIGSIVGNVLIRTKYLPAATAANFHQVAMLGFGLHMVGPVLAAGAVALAPRSKALHGVSVLVLAIAVAFTLFLIFTGIFTITYVR